MGRYNPLCVTFQISTICKPRKCDSRYVTEKYVAYTFSAPSIIGRNKRAFRELRRLASRGIYNWSGGSAGQWAGPRGVHNAAYIKMTFPAFQLAIFNSCSFIDEEKPWQCRVSFNTLIVNRQTSPVAAPLTIERWSIKMGRSLPISQLHLLWNVWWIGRVVAADGRVGGSPVR